MPISEGSQLTARIFLVKMDKDAIQQLESGNAMNAKKVKLATGEIKWTETKTLTNGGIKLNAKDVALNLYWFDNQPVDINPNEDWRIVGIIGGGYDNLFHPDAAQAWTTPGTNNEDTKRKAEEAKEYCRKMYRFYVDFNTTQDHYKQQAQLLGAINKQNLVQKTLHNTLDNEGRQRIVAPFTTGWSKVNITAKNKISMHNWLFKPIGVLLKFKIKRNTQLLPAKAHNYTFTSSQITGQGGFLMAPLNGIFTDTGVLEDAKEAGLDCQLRPEVNDITTNFYWNFGLDRRPHYYNPTGDVKDEDEEHGYTSDLKGGLYEYRYTFNSKLLQPNNDNREYDIVYVWGMPMTQVVQKGKIQHQSFITAEKGSFMLGCKHKNLKDNLNRKVEYADEWCFAKSKDYAPSDEYRFYDFTNKSGKAYLIELGVTRPRFSAIAEDGYPKYAWANPLERLAQTNSITNKKGAFRDDVRKYSQPDNWGRIDGMSIQGKELKMHFTPEYPDRLYPGYNVPNSVEWGTVFFNIYTNSYDKILGEGSWGFLDSDGMKQIPWAPGSVLELFDPFKDDERNIITTTYEAKYNAAYTQDIHEYSFYKNSPAFLSYYSKNDYRGTITAMRFIGNGVYGTSGKVGNRYRCAYRWCFYDLDKDFHNENKKPRVVVQSRWIGNAPVSIKDIADEKWWGLSSTKAILFNTDCYRVLSMVGFPYATTKTLFNSGYPYICGFWSRVIWDYKKGGPDEHSEGSNKTFVVRKASELGMIRGHNDNDTKGYPVRCMAKRKLDEFGKDAPRVLQKPKDLEEYINRPNDKKEGITE